MKTEHAEPHPTVSMEDALAQGPKPVPTGRSLTRWLYPALVVASFLLGLLVSFPVWGRQPARVVAAAAQASAPTAEAAPGNTGQALAEAFLREVNPPQGYKLPVSYGSLGPQLLQEGAIDFDKFAAVYAEGGAPLSQAQIQILKQGSNEPIVINSDNAHFLLNFFWAVGLANQNPILTDGPIARQSNGHIGGFASTGGWTIGARPVTELFAAIRMISLSPEQQARVQEAAAAIYRPCCDNSTFFPDCNHGMAMLGLLELMGSQDASLGDMLTAAKYVNAYWFPQQAIETAIFLKAAQNVDFADADARLVVGAELSSGSGSGQVHAQLKAKGLLPASPDNGGGCGA